MKVYTSPFFYLPVAVLLSINTGLQDLGLWQRMAMGGILGLAILGNFLEKFQQQVHTNGTDDTGVSRVATPEIWRGKCTK